MYAADNYMMAPDIVKLIKELFNPPNDDQNNWNEWYNWIGEEEANKFFTPNYYPLIASMQLGYPCEEPLFDEQTN